jgi:predicted transposase YbfD/YdcC
VRVKDNQPRLRDALAALCAERAPSGRLETVDRGRHGRQEHRRVEVFAVADQLPPEWRATIACAARVSRLSWCKDTRTGLWRPRREVAYYVSQARLDAEGFGRAVRAHWGIENRDHHVRDRVLREDDSRIRRRPGVFARLRSFALNILRANGVTNVSEAVYVNALSLDQLLTCGLAKSQN